MQTWNCAEVLTQKEVDRLHAQALTILDEVGVLVQNAELLDLLAGQGARVDRGREVVRFPRAWMERFIADSSDDYDDDDSLVVSCTLPYGRRRAYVGGMETTAGSYPQFYLDLEGQVRPHTAASVADMTRLADALEHIDRLGVMGCASDVPRALDPLYMRLLAWKHAARKRSGCGEVRDARLIPYIFEMGQIAAAAKNAPADRYIFAEVELLSPLRLGRVEAEILVQFWKNGYKAGVGFMPIAGASAPATLAATVSILLAESLFVSILYRACYGLKKLYLQSNSSVLDMRSGWFPFNRPERALLILAMGQMARFYRAGLWASAIHSDSKGVDIEAGLGASFNAIPAVLAGTIGLECYGLISGGEASSPLQLVIDDEYLGAIKRFVAGFEVTDETLACDLIREQGIGGSFLDADHTVRHYRREHWMPGLLTHESLSHWMAGEHKLLVDRAREKTLTILREHHPQGLDEAAEKAIRAVIQQAQKALDLSGH